MAEVSPTRKIALPLPTFDDVPEERRRNMAAVRRKNTAPEMLVRKALHRLGYRYRVHDRRLPSCPDLVFAGRKAVVFVHGCFWHHHEAPGCRKSVIPKTRRDWWRAKLDANRARDALAVAALEAQGWRCEIVWECETNRDLPTVIARLREFLGSPSPLA